MPLWGWFLTLSKGFLPIDGKRIGKIIWLGVWITLALTIYHKVFEPKNVTRIERIEHQIVNQCQPDKSILRLRFWRILNISFGD